MNAKFDSFVAVGKAVLQEAVPDDQLAEKLGDTFTHLKMALADCQARIVELEKAAATKKADEENVKVTRVLEELEKKLAEKTAESEHPLCLQKTAEGTLARLKTELADGHARIAELDKFVAYAKGVDEQRSEGALAIEQLKKDLAEQAKEFDALKRDSAEKLAQQNHANAELEERMKRDSEDLRKRLTAAETCKAKADISCGEMAQAIKLKFDEVAELKREAETFSRLNQDQAASLWKLQQELSLAKNEAAAAAERYNARDRSLLVVDTCILVDHKLHQCAKLYEILSKTLPKKTVDALKGEPPIMKVIRIVTSVAKVVILESVTVSKFYVNLMEWKTDRNQVCHEPQHHSKIANDESSDSWEDKLDRIIDALNRCISYLKKPQPDIESIQSRLSK